MRNNHLSFGEAAWNIVISPVHWLITFLVIVGLNVISGLLKFDAILHGVDPRKIKIGKPE